jgi:hypothetical protein
MGGSVGCWAGGRLRRIPGRHGDVPDKEPAQFREDTEPKLVDVVEQPVTRYA